MDVARRELLIARICSGSVRIVIASRGRDKTYLVKRPGRDHAYVAAELYLEVFRESELEGLYDEEELMSFLLDNGLWDEESDKLLKALPKEVEEFKVKLYRSSFKSKEKLVIRKALEIAKAKMQELYSTRNAYGHLSCSGASAIAKTRYLVGSSLYTSSGVRVFGDDDFWESESGLLDDVLSSISRCRIDESEMRELARTDPWRSLWNCGKTGEVFGVCAADYTDEQRALVNWTMLYDNVYGHPECPSDDVVADDDLLDGWMILQRREREKKLSTKEGEELISNEKIRNSQEVFLVAETVDDARKVVDLNDEFGKVVQRRRFKHLKDKGEVDELDMPDTRQRLRMEMTQMVSKGKVGP